MKLDGKQVTIIGAKRSGLALARLIRRSGGRPKISDQGRDDQLSAQVKAWLKENKIPMEFNQHTKKFIEASDLVVLSPGVRIDAEPVLWAKAKNIPTIGEIEFSFQFCVKPVIAVTGSNGKTTTVTLIKEVVEAAGKKASLCGNVGWPFAEAVTDLKDKDYVVLEISSFQMESLLDKDSPFRKAPWHFKGFQPHIAVILNFSQNHLDRHKDLQEYFDAKKKICLNQTENDFTVLNYQSDRLRALAKELQSKTVFFDSPDEKIAFKVNNPNHLAVIETARVLGIKDDVCKKVFENFKGVEHRLEWVRTLNGVDFINDSKATTAEASGWALKNIERPIIMICGGRDKNIDYSVLSKLVQKKVKKMITIGEAKTKIRKVFENVVDVEECDRLEKAVERARASSAPGDCVVLSPMCASFDMFKDYEDRGKIFKEIVQRLN